MGQRWAMATGIPLLQEFGSSGLNQWSGIVHEEWASQLSGAKRHRVFREMSDNDATIGAVLYAMEFLIRSVPITFEPAKNSGPEGDRWAKHAEECWGDTVSTPAERISEILTMLPHGFAPLETVYKLRGGESAEPRFRSKYGDRMIGWRDLSLRAQETVEQWEFGSCGDVTALRQVAPPLYRDVWIPAERLLLFRWRSNKKNPEGRSILRNAWRSWFFLKRLQEVEAIGIERNLAGLPVIFVPDRMLSPAATAEERAQVVRLKKIAAKVRFNEFAGLVMPNSVRPGDEGSSGFDFQLMSSSGRNNTETDTIIRRYESRMAMTVLGEFVLLGLDQHGSFALADSKTSLFSILLRGIMDSIEGVFNRQALPDLVAVNGGDRRLAPRMVFGDVEQRNLAEIATYLTQGVQGAWITPDKDLEKWARSLVPGMPEPSSDSMAPLDSLFQQSIKAAAQERVLQGP